MSTENATVELTPLSELSAEQFAAALDANKASGLAKLYGVTVSTIHYYKQKHAGIKRQPSVAQLEQILVRKQERIAARAAKGAVSNEAAEAAKAAKQAEREAQRLATQARREELLAQIAALSTKPAAVAAE